MVDYKEKNAVYALNSYIWKLLEANLGWEKVNTTRGLLTPIIPVAQQPEFLQTGKGFIVYGSAIHPATHLYQHKKEAASYMIYSTSTTDVNRIVNLLTDTFERQDVAAQEVNDWLAEEAKPTNRGSHRGVYFTTLSADMAEKAEDAAEEEGGYYAGMVLITMKYTTDAPVIQTTGFTY